MTRSSTSRTSAFVLLSITLGLGGLVGSTGCSVSEAPSTDDEGESDSVSSPIIGANLGGMNLAGLNLGGTNLSGTNLGGTNLAGTNLSGTNLAGTNLAGTNLAGTNLGGTNLAGTNLGATALGGTKLTGVNVGTATIVGTNLGSTTLAASNTGSNIYGLSSTAGSMLYSAADIAPGSTCTMLGFSSAAFQRLIIQQSANARISVALGKLPWGFSSTAGGPSGLDAWEAVTWGDRGYCSFVLLAPPGTAWSGVAGFLKAVFRWGAPATQSIDISGIEAALPYDPTMKTSIDTYTGMMGAALAYKSGSVSKNEFMAGQLALVTATTNNQSVWVDFSAWVLNASGSGSIMGNVDNVTPPRYSEAAYSTFKNSDGTYGVSITPLAATTNVVSASDELGVSYNAWRYGQAPKPVATRCPGALYLTTKFGEPYPSDQCDAGLSWVEPGGGYPTGNATWATVSGTTAPMNTLQSLPSGTAAFYRAAGKQIGAETYTFLWEPNHNLPAAAIGGSTGSNRASLGVAASSTAPCVAGTAVDAAFNPLSTAPWCATGAATTTTPASLMYSWGASIPITSYRITSAADTTAADPKSWTFQGCKGTCTVASDTGWVTLDTRSAEAFASRLLTKSYAFTNTTAYSQYRLRVTAGSSAATSTQLRQLQLFDSGGAIVALTGVDKTEAGVVSWTGKSCSTSELATRAFDNLKSGSSATRWCASSVPSAAQPVSAAYKTNASYAATSYRITSAVDLPARDPKAWTFQGCDGSCRAGTDAGWVTLDTRTAEAFASRALTKSYAFTNGTAYPQYRLRVTANSGDTTSLQVGEIEIF
jgi:Pentapeptide repeats (8 copies)